MSNDMDLILKVDIAGVIEDFILWKKSACLSPRIPLIVLAKASEPETFLLFPNELEENHSINLICKANVGSPQGTIKIWKLFKNNTSEMVYVSNTTTNNTENCTEFLNVNATYTVTKDDNGAVFRCSSQNNFIQGQGPHMDSSKITVICIFTIFHKYIFHGFLFYLQYTFKTYQFFLILCFLCKRIYLDIIAVLSNAAQRNCFKIIIYFKIRIINCIK